jgi:lipopolysaccharide/colanic/teichoic acid biosynthesis glycosyltransferase
MENQRNLSQPVAFAPSPILWWLHNASKRLVDVLISGLGLLLLSPVFGLLAFALKREEPGPIYYRGSRTGRDGKEFNILKFRTMHETPESYAGPRVTAQDDERITSLGKWLRDTKLNELPQLWNVLIGEMSLVGPRPEDPEIVGTWPEDARREILSVRPGITSPATVLYRNEEKLLSADNVMDVYLRDILPDKLRLDRLYVRHHSLLTDLDILFWTAAALLPNVELQRISEGRFFAGPIYRLTRRHISWFLIDLIVCLGAVTLVGSLWRAIQIINWGPSNFLLLACALSFLFSLMNLILGLDNIMWSRATAEDGLILLGSNGISVIAIMLLNHLQEENAWLPFPALPPELIVLIGATNAVAVLAVRYRFRLVTSFASRWLSWRKESAAFGERVLILGAGESGQIVHWLLQRGSLRQVFTVVGMVDDDPAKQGMRVDGCWVLGGTSDLPDLVRARDIGLILFAITNLTPEERERVLKLCQLPGLRVVFLNDILGTVQSRLSSSLI